jgi:hypothetical protein
MQQQGGEGRGKKVHQRGRGGRGSKGVTSWREGSKFDNKEMRRVWRNNEMSYMMLRVVIISFDFIIEDDNSSFFFFFCELGYSTPRARNM